MDRPPLTMPEQLRVWRLAGVRSLFVSEETRQAFLAHRRTAPSQAGQGGPVPLCRPGVQPGQTNTYQYTPPQHTQAPPVASASASATTESPPTQKPSAVHTPNAHSATPPASARSPQPTPPPVPQEPLQENTATDSPWDRYTKLMPERPRVIWSYWELGLDLLGQGDPRRGALWRNLRSKVKWPQGFLGFWPLSAPQDNVLQPAPTKFFSGIESFQPRYVLVFGKAGFEALFPNDRFTLGAKPAHGRIIHILPDPAELMTDENDAVSRTLHILWAIRSG